MDKQQGLSQENGIYIGFYGIYSQVCSLWNCLKMGYVAQCAQKWHLNKRQKGDQSLDKMECLMLDSPIFHQ